MKPTICGDNAIYVPSQAPCTDCEIFENRLDEAEEDIVAVGQEVNALSTYLNTRIDNIIAGPASSAEEVIDARLGADGVTYPSLGDAIRSQISNLNNDMDQIANGYTVLNPIFEEGSLNNTTGQPETKNYRVRSADFFATSDVELLLIDRSLIPYAVYLYYYDNSEVLQERTSGQTTEEIVISKDYQYFKIVALNYKNGGYSNPISPQEATRDIKYVTTSEVYKELEKVKKHTPEPIGILQYPKTFVVSASGDSLKVYFEGSVYVRGKVTRGRTFAQLLSELGSSDGYITIPHGFAWVFDAEDMTNKIVSVNSPTNVKTSYIIMLAVWWGKVASGILQYEVDKALCYPPYFAQQVSSVISDIKMHSETAGKDGISFSFITDIHWGNNQKFSPYLIKAIVDNTNVNTVILGGDYIGQYPDSKQTAMDVMRECIDSFKNLSGYVYPIFGNHDRNSNQTTSSVYMTKAETYAIINKWMKSESGYGDYFNFYIDDFASKTRIICIDTGAQSIDGGVITAAAQTWVQNLIDALGSDWHIVIVAHWLFSPTTWNHPLVDGVLTGSYTSSANALFTSLDAINTDSSKPKVEAIITGHVHCDYNDATSGGIPIIFVDTDSKGAYGEYPAETGTVSEQCFDVITVDYTNEKIYCDRIGRGVSREISY